MLPGSRPSERAPRDRHRLAAARASQPVPAFVWASTVALGFSPLLFPACAANEPPVKQPKDFSGSFERPEEPDEPFLQSYGDGYVPDEDAEPIDFPSCDQAREDHGESLDLARPSGSPPDISASTYSDLLGRGTYLERCAVPRATSVTVCAAVIDGRAVGITVTLDPHHQGIVNCIVEAIQQIEFPSHPKLDVATTRFAAGG